MVEWGRGGEKEMGTVLDGWMDEDEDEGSERGGCWGLGVGNDGDLAVW